MSPPQPYWTTHYTSCWKYSGKEFSFDILLSRQLVAALLDNVFVLSCVSYYVYDVERQLRAARSITKSLESDWEGIPAVPQSAKAYKATSSTGCVNAKLWPSLRPGDWGTKTSRWLLPIALAGQLLVHLEHVTWPVPNTAWGRVTAKII